MSVPANYQLCFSGYGRRVWIANSVVEAWHSQRQTSADDPEDFGVLIGTTSEDRRERWIDFITRPMDADKQSRFNFELMDPGHQQAVDGAFDSSSGTKIYLGTWHTHPESVPQPSGVDIADWNRCIGRNRNRPLVFVIVGIEQTCLFLPWGCLFKSLIPSEELR